MIFPIPFISMEAAFRPVVTGANTVPFRTLETAYHQIVTVLAPFHAVSIGRGIDTYEDRMLKNQIIIIE